jgi:hypothetical protein
MTRFYPMPRKAQGEQAKLSALGDSVPFLPRFLLGLLD